MTVLSGYITTLNKQAETRAKAVLLTKRIRSQRRVSACLFQVVI
jgi:hypothetical protein